MIETTRLRLVHFELEHLDALKEGTEKLAEDLSVRIPDGWPHFPEAYASDVFRSWVERTEKDVEVEAWGTYLFLLRDGSSLVGSGGYKGKPVDGGVEIGYEVAPQFRNKGFATEAAQALVDEAFRHTKVEHVLAHTLPEPNASTRVLEKIGMSQIGEIEDPDDGLIWRWRIVRSAYETTG